MGFQLYITFIFVPFHFFRPGRASGSPTLDVFITLLSMGKKQYLDLVKARKVLSLLPLSAFARVVPSYGQSLPGSRRESALCPHFIAGAPPSLSVQDLMVYFRREMQAVAVECGERMLETGHNSISMGR